MLGRQFFHGTRRDIEGGKLLPSSKTGYANFDYDYAINHMGDGPIRKQRIFMVDSAKAGDSWGEEPAAIKAERHAWSWANQGSQAWGEEVPGRPRVHVVKPRDYKNLEDDGLIGHASMHTSAKILDTIWTPPPSQHDEVVQGTLPPYNWNEVGPITDDDGYDVDANYDRYVPAERAHWRQHEETYRAQDAARTAARTRQEMDRSQLKLEFGGGRR